MVTAAEILEIDKSKSPWELCIEAIDHVERELPRISGAYATSETSIRRLYGRLGEMLFFSQPPQISPSDLQTCDYIAAGTHVSRAQILALQDTFQRLLPSLREPKTNIYPVVER